MKPLEVMCPECFAAVGASCTTERDIPTAPCRGRRVVAENRTPVEVIRVQLVGEQLGFFGSPERIEVRTVGFRAPVKRGSVGVRTGKTGMVVEVFEEGRCVHSESTLSYGQVPKATKLAIARRVLGPDALVSA